MARRRGSDVVVSSVSNSDSCSADSEAEASRSPIAEAEPMEESVARKITGLPSNLVPVDYIILWGPGGHSFFHIRRMMYSYSYWA